MTDTQNNQLEALHACHMIGNQFETFVLGSEFVFGNPDLMARAVAVVEAIDDMYQAIGCAEEKESTDV